jgi:hypothetical protein
LLSDLKKTVDDDAAWRRLVDRHSHADRTHISLILERLD